MSSIIDFESFLGDVQEGQPLHRLVLGQDDVRAVVHDRSLRTLELTQQLMKARTVELAQRLTVPQQTFTPPGLSMGASSTPSMGMGLGPTPPTGPKE